MLLRLSDWAYHLFILQREVEKPLPEGLQVRSHLDSNTYINSTVWDSSGKKLAKNAALSLLEDMHSLSQLSVHVLLSLAFCLRVFFFPFRTFEYWSFSSISLHLCHLMFSLVSPSLSFFPCIMDHVFLMRFFFCLYLGASLPSLCVIPPHLFLRSWHEESETGQAPSQTKALQRRENASFRLTVETQGTTGAPGRVLEDWRAGDQ